MLDTAVMQVTQGMPAILVIQATPRTLLIPLIPLTPHILHTLLIRETRIVTIGTQVDKPNHK